jgi:hypothetical protein
MTEHEALGKRLAAARTSVVYEIALELPVERASPAPIVMAGLVLGAGAILPLVCLAVAKEPPWWTVGILLGLSALMVAILVSATRRWWSAHGGSITHELVAVIERSAWQLGETRNHFLTLWNPALGSRKQQLIGGEPHVEAGDIGVAVFRDDHLVNVIRLPRC